jgi:ABC-type nitrate/sulfonate/bicarbonate transport system permease component
MAETRVIAAPASAGFAWPKLGVTGVRILTIVAIVAIWEGMARSGLLYKDVVPPIERIIVAIYNELLAPAFYYHLWITFAEVAVGFVVGSLIGLALGIVLGTNEYFRKAMEPYLNAIGSTPKIIFLPIIFLMFGVGMESKMAKGAFSGFFPMVFSTTLGMILINPVLLRVGKSFHLNQWQTITKIYLPAMVNPVIVGLRLALGVTIIGILVAEIKFSDGGVGFRLIQYYDQFKIAPMYAMLVLIFALAAFGNFGMTKLQDKFNWNMSSSGKKSSSHGSLRA